MTANKLCGDLSDLHLDDVLNGIPKNDEIATKAAYEGMRTKMGLVRLKPWADLLAEERLAFVTFVMVGRHLGSSSKKQRRR
jgi:hypothetical protein